MDTDIPIGGNTPNIVRQDIYFHSLEKRIDKDLNEMTTQVHSTVTELVKQMQAMNEKFNQFDQTNQQIGDRLAHLENTNSQSQKSSSSHNTQSLYTETPNRNQHVHHPISQLRGDNHNLKIKPPKYDGSEDLTEFLTSFEICSDINKWRYNEKGLYLASSLKGNARSILIDLSNEERSDYRELQIKLHARFGSENKAEMFRAQLKTRSRSNGESYQDLAQSIRSLTRKAYPKTSSDVIEVISLDHFIDAIDDSQIRLRLRDLNLNSITQAEEIATKMEAYRISERLRSPVPNSNVNQDRSTHTTNLTQVCEGLQQLSNKFDRFINNQHLPSNNSQGRQYHTQSKGDNSTNHYTPQNRQNRNQNQYNYHQTNDQNTNWRLRNTNETYHQGNENRSNWRSSDRQH